MGSSESSGLSGQAADRLRAEQFSALLRHSPGVMLANLCNALVFVVSRWGTPEFDAALSWAAVVWSIVGLIHVRRRMRRTTPQRSDPRRSRGVRAAAFYAFALGSAWGALPLLFFDAASNGGKLLIACLSSGMMGGGAFVLASIPTAAMAFMGPIALGSLMALLRAGDSDYMLIAAILAVYTAVLVRGTFGHADGMKAFILSQLESERQTSSRFNNLNAAGAIAAGLVHEISQPLAAAAAYLGTARRLVHMPPEERPVPIERALDGAAEQVENTREIIGHLRRLIMHGETAKTFVQLHEVIEAACDAPRVLASLANIRLELNLAASSDLVLADRLQIGEVVSNLIDNAIDAMATSAERKLAVSTGVTREGSIQIDVSDTGPGLSPAVRATLFQPFVTTKVGGMGVGLAIARAIVEAHEGRIWAEPNSGGGAVFSFTLPLAAS